MEKQCDDIKLILFGAGKKGREALEKYGQKNVAFFVTMIYRSRGNLLME